MDNGASSYRRFRDKGDETGLVEIIRDYKDGLIFYLYSFVGDINVAIDYLRRNARRREVPLDEYKEFSGEAESLELAYLREERKIIVHKAIRKLKTEYQQILWLIYFEEFSHKEAALVMKKSVHNIETLVYRARKSLKSQLEMEGFIYEEL